MESVRVASQRLRQVTYGKLSSGKDITLPAGAYIRCVKKCYLPKGLFGDYDEVIFVAAYTQLGMALIPNRDLDWSVY